MTKTYLLDDFKNQQGNLKHITIGLPNKKSGWRVNLQIAGVVSKSIAIKKTSLSAALDILLPIMLENKTDLTNTDDGNKITSKELKEKYSAALKYSLEEKTEAFKQIEKNKPPKNTKNLSELIFKQSGAPRYYNIREPYDNTSISIRVTKDNYSKNFSLVEHNIKYAVDNSFKHVVEKLDCEYSESEYTAVKVTLINKLIDKYDELCKEVGETGLQSKFNSLASEFYKNGKWHCFSIKHSAKHNLTPYINFIKAGKTGISRSLERHNFTDAFEEIFRHGCKQVDINPDFIALQPIKALLKKHLQKQIKLT